jgi:hypothetical protein
MTLKNFARIGRIVLGLFVFLSGWALAFLELYLAIRTNRTAHMTHIITSGLLLVIGGYIMSPAVAEQIADNIVDKLPLLDRIPGGRRKTDPPPEEQREP